MAIPNDVIKTLPPQPLEALEGQIVNGDLLLCAANDPFSRLIGWATQAPWSHVAIAYRWPTLGRTMAIESVQKEGVRIIALERFISQTSDGTSPFPGDIILARHDRWDEIGSDEEKLRAFTNFAVDGLGDFYSVIDLVRIGLRIGVSRYVKKMPRMLAPKNEYICSEYAAGCYKSGGIDIQWNGLGFISPSDIARDPNVHAVARFKTT
jgi:hypothetical protein